MSATQPPVQAKKKSLLYRIGKVLLIVIASLIFLVILVVILIQTPPVQNFARKKVQAYMTNKLHTRFEIGRIYIGFPKKIVLENLYVEDRQKDTLLYGGSLKVNISMFKLLKSEVEINDIELSDLTAKIKRTLPDTTFNFQFIVDAFAPAKPDTTTSADTSALKMAIKTVALDKIRLVYNDVITGNDMTLWLTHLDSDIDTFDITHMKFDVPDFNLRGIKARIYQTKPLVEPKPLAQNMAEAAQPIAFQLNLGDVKIQDIDLDYGNDVSAFYTKLNLGELNVKSKNIDLANRTVILDNLELKNTTAGIRLGKKQAAVVAKEEIKERVQVQAQNDWRFAVNEIRIDGTNLQFDDDNSPKLTYGMDYSHLKADQLTLHADDFLFSKDSMSASITKGEVKEKSGFQLNTLQTDFLYASNEAYLKNLLIETPGTTLKRSAIIRYPSLEAVQKDIGKLQMDVDLNNSRIQVKDILVFAPFLKAQPAFSNPSSTIFVNGRVKGSVARLQIPELQFRGLSDTKLDVRGDISGLPDVNKLQGNIVLNNLHTNKKDIQSLMPAGTLPSTITLPDNINVKGTASGSMASAKADLNVTTNLGSASVKGTIKNGSNPKQASYNATINTRDLDLGTIMQNDSMYGPLTASVVASGKGFDIKTANADVKGTIQSAVLMGYNYKDVNVQGSLQNQQAVASVSIADPNITLALNANADLSKEYPGIAVDGTVDSIKTLPLHLTTTPLFYHGKIHGDFPITDPKNLQGDLLVTESIFTTADQRFVVDTIQLHAANSDSGHVITFQSDAVAMKLWGKYDLAQLGYVFQDAIQPYFSIVPAYKAATLSTYDFKFSAQLINRPLLKVFLPDLQRLDPININGTFSSTNGWKLTAVSPMIVNGTMKVQNFTVNAGTTKNAIKLKATIDHIASGATMNLYETSFDVSVANNKINFIANLKDKGAKVKYRLGGILEQPKHGDYLLALNSDSLLLNYNKWVLSKNNSIRFTSGDLNIHEFVLSKDEQKLTINSQNSGPNAPLDVSFANFRIGTITGFLKQDSLLADGSINGKAVLRDLMKAPTFTSDLNISNLSINKDTVGNLAIKVDNPVPDKFTADIAITGFDNDVRLNGDYTMQKDGPGAFDLKLDMRRLNLKSMEGLTAGAIRNSKGYLSGNFAVAGSFDKPDVNGQINFNNTGFVLGMLNTYFTIDDESVKVNQQGITFDTFTIRDSSRNALVLDGNMATTNFLNYKFDLRVTANNFQAINTTKRDNQLYYGKLFFNTNLHITGTESAPAIDGGVTINEKTDLSIVLPQAEPGVVEREGIVRFVDMDSVRIDTSMLLTKNDSLNTSPLAGMDVSINVELNKNAQFSVIIDEGNGDFLRMKGEGLLTGGIDKSGKITLTGTYEIDQGSYELSFNAIHRKFDIKKGSKITWLGEPTRASLDVTALYATNTAPYSLVEGQIQPDNRFKQRLPFEVNLILKNQLMKPDITFDIILQKEKNLTVSSEVIETVDTRLEQIRQEPSEMNKQVFALLLMNRFVSDNPFDNSGGGGFNAGAFARQSVSKLLTQQLNNLAADLIQGVEVNFDVTSQEDYTSGNMTNRTDLNVSVSKQILSDRLKVTVGSNFELEGPQNTTTQTNNLAGNIALDYMLSKDGRYMIRGYRKNEYEGELDGYVIETGVNFIITLDYNKFKELFQKKRKDNNKSQPENKNASGVSGNPTDK